VEIARWVPFPRAIPQLQAALRVQRVSTAALRGCRRPPAIVQLLPIQREAPKMNRARNARKARSAQSQDRLSALLARLDIRPPLVAHHVKLLSMNKL
jgi:hypothetical protein